MPHPTIYATMAGDESDLQTLIDIAKQEDLGGGDVTTSITGHAHDPACLKLISRQRGILAGGQVAHQILKSYSCSGTLDWESAIADGNPLPGGNTPVATLRGPLGDLLAAERVLLNFLQRLSGIATLTNRYVQAIDGTAPRIFDTRKTTPGWRSLERHAVRCGGGCSHRHGLYDAVLLKDNHLFGVASEQLASTLFDMLNRLSSMDTKPDFVEVEVDSLDQFDEVLKVVGVDLVLLDNFSQADLAKAVKRRADLGLRDTLQLEASGNVSLETVRSIAETGIDRISVGALTHSAPALDLSMERVS